MPQDNQHILLYKQGQILVKEGEFGESLFVILSGKVNVFVKENLVASLSENDFFGEMSLLLQQKRGATVIADEDTEVLIVEEDTFDEMLSENFRVCKKILISLADRVDKTNRVLEVLKINDPLCRIIAYFLNQFSTNDKKIGRASIPVNLNQIAAECSLKSEICYDKVKKLEAQGYLKRTPAGIEFSNIKKLEDLKLLLSE